MTNKELEQRAQQFQDEIFTEGVHSGKYAFICGAKYGAESQAAITERETKEKIWSDILKHYKEIDDGFVVDRLERIIFGKLFHGGTSEVGK